MINLRQALRLDLIPLSEIRMAFAGSGGKTTAMFQLARELQDPVLVTTSTHLGSWQVSLADRHIQIGQTKSLPTALGAQARGVTLFTGTPGENERIHGLDTTALENLLALADHLQCPLLVEADGSRQLPLKAPAGHEPAIPVWARQVVVAAGLSALGKPLDETVVHRFERYAQLANQQPGSEITAETIVRVLLHPAGGQKGIPQKTRCTALLTQTAGTEQLETAMHMAETLLVGFDSVIISEFASRPDGSESGSIHALVEPTAGILLTAGSASRFGTPKVLVDWQGKPLVRHIAEIALQGGLSPLITVLGAVDDPVRRALEDLPVEFIQNDRWQAGQSTSLHAGLNALPPQAGSALFLLGDQPFVTAGLIRALRLDHTLTLAPVIAPQINGRRANPVLFDRVTFPDLMRISGDTGGRAIFHQYPPRWLPWQDERLLLDMDTPEEYERLKRLADKDPQ